MILIDQPFASDFLIKTIKENNFQIIETSIAKEMIDDCSLNWISENEAIDIYKNRADFPIYTNSENAIGWIEKNLPFSELPAKIQLFKNKIAFRELIKDAFPNYFFKGVKFEDLKTITEASIQFPLIIKPSVGFFSLAVYKVDNWEEWASTLPKIKTEIDSFKNMYPKEVVDATSFILEAYIEGEEHAIDCYFNEKGAVVILNILHHIFSSDKDVSDRVYSNSKEIFEMYYTEIEQFLQKNKKVLAWVILYFSVILGIYTGILFSAFNARPLWNTSILGPLFLTSGLSAAAAVIILFSKRQKTACAIPGIKIKNQGLTPTPPIGL